MGCNCGERRAAAAAKLRSERGSGRYCVDIGDGDEKCFAVYYEANTYSKKYGYPPPRMA